MNEAYKQKKERVTELRSKASEALGSVAIFGTSAMVGSYGIAAVLSSEMVSKHPGETQASFAFAVLASSVSALLAARSGGHFIAATGEANALDRALADYELAHNLTTQSEEIPAETEALTPIEGTA